MDYLKTELVNKADINIVNVEIRFGEVGKITIVKNKYTDLQITLKSKKENEDTSSCYAKIIFHSILLNANINDGIFHINGVWDFELCKIAKENGFRVVLTQHSDFLKKKSINQFTQY